MGLFTVFDVSGSAMSAQSVRLNTVASNMANSEVASPTEEAAYRSRQPLFKTVFQDAFNEPGVASVKVERIEESQAPPTREFAPNHPMANEEGYIFKPNVNPIEEMANMISASRSYQNNVEVLSSAKQMLQATLQLGKGQ